MNSGSCPLTAIDDTFFVLIIFSQFILTIHVGSTVWRHWACICAPSVHQSKTCAFSREWVHCACGRHWTGDVYHPERIGEEFSETHYVSLPQPQGNPTSSTIHALCGMKINLRHPFLSWNRSNEVKRKFFHYCFLGGDSNRGRSPRSHRNDWPRSFLWGNELGLHQTSQGFCSRGHSRGYACLIKRRPWFGARSLWRNWDPCQRGCRKPISRFIKEPIKLEMQHRPFHWWFYPFIR